MTARGNGDGRDGRASTAEAHDAACADGPPTDAAPAFWSHADMYANGAYAPMPQEHRTGGSFGLNLIDVRQDAIETVDPATPDVAFISVLDADGASEVHFGDRWRRFERTAHTVHIHPANTDGALRIPALHLRALSLPHACLAARLDEVGLTPSALDHVTGELRYLPDAARAIDAAWHASETGGAGANLMIDGAFTTLLGLLLRANGDGRLLAPVPSVGDRRIGRVVDYIEAHLPEPMTTDELAGVAAISLFHFTRVFRDALGLTPHRYVQRRRVERAKAMLLDPRAPLAQIAHACGFASQSHFGQVFKAHTGATPGQWREGAA